MGNPTGGYENMRILIVDDYEIVRNRLKVDLKGLGFVYIDEATNGSEALAKLYGSLTAQTPYDFVICDWNMPEKDGLKVLCEIRAHPKLVHLPFIMVTAESEQNNVVEAFKMGASDYIVKPFKTATLQEKVFKVLLKLKVS
jgi:two-component system chemotaxis response regulator CheY